MPQTGYSTNSDAWRSAHVSSDNHRYSEDYNANRTGQLFKTSSTLRNSNGRPRVNMPGVKKSLKRKKSQGNNNNSVAGATIHQSLR